MNRAMSETTPRTRANLRTRQRLIIVPYICSGGEQFRPAHRQARQVTVSSGAERRDRDAGLDGSGSRSRRESPGDMVVIRTDGGSFAAVTGSSSRALDVSIIAPVWNGPTARGRATTREAADAC